MKIILSQNKEALGAYNLVKTLQLFFVKELENLSLKDFQEDFWFRNKGLNGGGNRFKAINNDFFNTASVNVSHLHYDNKKLINVAAISTIIHPTNPSYPSFHMHISYTQIKNEISSYRIMADLNPSIYNEKDKNIFLESIQKSSFNNYEEGIQQGDKYFFIPSLKKHRGCAHFYLENYFTNDKNQDYDFALNFGKKMISTYISILKQDAKKITNQNFLLQKNYHTLYFYQVLLLDRGTISGLLVHNENDLGILASLPKIINKSLLSSWLILQKNPQDLLLSSIIHNINDEGIIDDACKIKIIKSIREHYTLYPKALDLLASSNKTTNVIQNHK